MIIVGVLVAAGALAYYFRSTLLRMYEKTAVFLKEVRVEMQKVVWPNKQEVYGATFVVLVSVVILTVAIGIEDRLLSEILDLILSLALS
jgi:preprotein translocase subunit SecE